jgi:hypothetical protein
MDTKRTFSRGIFCKYGHDEWFVTWASDRGDTRFRCAACNRRSKQQGRRRNPLAALLGEARKRANRKGVPFWIDAADISLAWPEDGLCPVFGTLLRVATGASAPYSPSLDRIVPELGYTRNNIVVISHRANQLKNSATIAELEAVIDWMKRTGAK